MGTIRSPDRTSSLTSNCCSQSGFRKRIRPEALPLDPGSFCSKRDQLFRRLRGLAPVRPDVAGYATEEVDVAVKQEAEKQLRPRLMTHQRVIELGSRRLDLRQIRPCHH